MARAGPIEKTHVDVCGLLYVDGRTATCMRGKRSVYEQGKTRDNMNETSWYV